MARFKDSVELIVPARARKSAAQWAEEISGYWSRSALNFIAAGEALAQAKAALPHGEFYAMIEEKLPFEPRTAQRLMQIAADQRLRNPTLASLLPPSWDTLYELTRLDDVTFQARIEDGTISPRLKRSEIRNGLTEVRREERLGEMRELAANPMQVPAGPFATAIEDPPWEDPDAPIGFNDRHYRFKYATMTPRAIADMPFADSLGPHCFYALWITRYHLAIGSHLPVLEARRLKPRTVVTWDKVRPGLGNGFVRDRTEHIVFATRGDVAVPAPHLRPDSLFDQARSGRHSEKPSIHDWIEAWFPDMSRIEFFARRARAGWVAYGNQVEDETAPTDVLPFSPRHALAFWGEVNGHAHG